VPVIYEEYFICKEFGWTPNELAVQPEATISKFMIVSSLVNEK